MEIGVLTGLGVAAYSIGAIMDWVTKDPNQPDVDLVPPEFQRKRNVDGLTLSPTDLLRFEGSSLHNDYFSDHRPFSGSLFIQPDSTSTPKVIRRPALPAGLVRPASPEMTRLLGGIEERRVRDFHAEMKDHFEVEGHVFAEPVGQDNSWSRLSGGRVYRPASELHFRYIPERPYTMVFRPPPAGSPRDTPPVPLRIETMAPITVLGEEARPFAQLSLSTAGAGAIAMRGAYNIPNSAMSLFGSLPLYSTATTTTTTTSTNQPPESSGAALSPVAPFSQPTQTSASTVPPSLASSAGGAPYREQPARAIFNVEATDALHANAAEAVPFSGASARGKIDELKLGWRYDTPALQLGVYGKSAPIGCVSEGATSPTVAKLQPLFEPLQSAIDKPLSIGGWAGVKVGQVSAIVDGAANLTDNTSTANVALTYREVSRDTSGRVAPAYSLGADIRNWGKDIVASYLQRFIVRRTVRNPFESSNVKGIHNYIDLGVQMGFGTTPPPPSAPLATPPQSSDADASAPSAAEYPAPEGKKYTTISAVAAWQLNKNVLLKTRVRDSSLSFALGLKAWSEPSLALSAAYHLSFDGQTPSRVGLRLETENFGKMAYHRLPMGYSHQQRNKVVPYDSVYEEHAEL